MTRLPHYQEELNQYLGSQVSKEILLGRNYFYVENNKVKEDLFLNEIKDLYLTDNTDFRLFYDTGEINEESDYEPDELRSCKVKEYLASIITEDGWYKCLPTHPDDIEPGCAYIVIRVSVNEKYQINRIDPLIRFMEGSYSIISIPGQESLDSYLSPMSLITPEILDEFDCLVKGRHYIKGMSLIGMPIPTELEDIDKYEGRISLSKYSAFRNTSWHLSISIDDESKIKDFEIDSYVNESYKPYMASNDICEGIDCMLTLIDSYTDEDYEKYFT